VDVAGLPGGICLGVFPERFDRRKLVLVTGVPDDFRFDLEVIKQAEQFRKASFWAGGVDLDGSCRSGLSHAAEHLRGDVVPVRGAVDAPEDFHVASENDWANLLGYMGGQDVAGGKLKSTTIYNPPNIGATDEYGFSATPSGKRSAIGDFFDRLYKGYYWIKNINE